MRKTMWPALVGVTLVGFGCEANPTFPAEDDLDEEVTIAVTLSTDHLSTLTDVGITVAATDGHGEPFTDFHEIRMEFKHHDQDNWLSRELTLSDHDYVGSVMFKSSGEWDMRVVGTKEGHTSEEVLYTAHDHLEVERIHTEAGGFRIEFETFPGHVHEGEQAEVKFWIFEEDAAHPGTPHAHGGLDAEIHCTDADGAIESHHADEHMTGVYETMHTFGEAGEAEIEIHFEGDDGAEHHAAFHVPVSHAH